MRTAVLAAASTSALLQWGVSPSGPSVASLAGEPAVSKHRAWPRTAAGTGAALSATSPRTASRVSWRGAAARGPARSVRRGRIVDAAVPAAGLLRALLPSARTFAQAVLQCGVPLGVTSRAGSRGALSDEAPAQASAARDAASADGGHVVSMSLQVLILIQRG